jgi:hypothetical protein
VPWYGLQVFFGPHDTDATAADPAFSAAISHAAGAAYEDRTDAERPDLEAAAEVRRMAYQTQPPEMQKATEKQLRRPAPPGRACQHGRTATTAKESQWSTLIVVKTNAL